MFVEEKESYYAILNVPKDATLEDIKKAYKAMATVFHPDKHKEESLREKAAIGFAEINEAYEVLSDSQKRQVYDIYGKQGLMAGLAVGTKLKTTEELKAEWEKFRAQSLGDEDSDMMLNTILHCGIDAIEIEKIDMENIWAQCTVAYRIGNTGLIYIGGNVIVRGSDKENDGGVLLGGIKCTLPTETEIEINGTWGMKTMINLHTSQPLSNNISAFLTTSYSLQDKLGLTIGMQQILSNNARGNISWVLGPPTESGLTTSIVQNTKKYTASAKLQVGVNYAISSKFSYAWTEAFATSISGKLGLNGIGVEVGAIKKLSKNAGVNFSVSMGLQGVYMKTKWTIGGFTLEIPIILSKDPKEWKTAVMAVTLPPLIVSAMNYFMVRPLIKYYKKQKSNQERIKNAEMIKNQILIAQSQQNILKSVAIRNIREEASKSGLIIVEALYGIISEQQQNLFNNNDDIDLKILPPPLIDVTFALQYLIKDSQLRLYSGTSKCGLMGFCDPAPGQEKQLHIKFVFRNSAYTCKTNDMDDLMLPEKGVFIDDIEKSEELLQKSKTLLVNDNS